MKQLKQPFFNWQQKCLDTKDKVYIQFFQIAVTDLYKYFPQQKHLQRFSFRIRVHDYIYLILTRAAPTATRKTRASVFTASVQNVHNLRCTKEKRE